MQESESSEQAVVASAKCFSEQLDSESRIGVLMDAFEVVQQVRVAQHSSKRERTIWRQFASGLVERNSWLSGMLLPWSARTKACEDTEQR